MDGKRKTPVTAVAEGEGRSILPARDQDEKSRLELSSVVGFENRSPKERFSCASLNHGRPEAECYCVALRNRWIRLWHRERDTMDSRYMVSVPEYPELPDLVVSASPDWTERLANEIIPYLVRKWLGHYDLAATGGETVKVSPGKFSYLFDIGPDRLIAAWGISEGRYLGERDKARMQGHPIPNRPRYHAGHAIPHGLGGGTDINLAIQLGPMNVGPFRELERLAANTAESLYFTYWMYGLEPEAQLARRIQQGLLIGGHRPDIRVFNNQ